MNNSIKENGLLELSIFILVVAILNYIAYWLSDLKLNLLMAILNFIMGLITLNNWSKQK